MARQPEFTDAQLRAAFNACRKPGWPDTFEEAMQDPYQMQLVRLQARVRAIREKRSQDSAQQRRPFPTRPSINAPSAPPLLDHKRRAAGERDDD